MTRGSCRIPPVKMDCAGSSPSGQSDAANSAMRGWVMTTATLVAAAVPTTSLTLMRPARVRPTHSARRLPRWRRGSTPPHSSSSCSCASSTSGTDGTRLCLLHTGCSTGIALGAAREKVRVAHALAPLPVISATWRAARSTLRASADLAPGNEAALLDFARRGPPPMSNASSAPGDASTSGCGTQARFAASLGSLHVGCETAWS